MRLDALTPYPLSPKAACTLYVLSNDPPRGHVLVNKSLTCADARCWRPHAEILTCYTGAWLGVDLPKSALGRVSDMLRIHAAEAIAALEAAVEKRGPDYIYPNEYAKCSYVKDGEPSCLVGEALAILGIPIEALSALDIAAEGNSISASEIRFPNLGAIASTKAKDVLQYAQSVQDRGYKGQRGTWGAALERAKEAANASA